MATVGIFEAKTRLAELVRQVEEGKSFTITVRGKAKAELVQVGAGRHPEAAAAIDDLLAMPLVRGVEDETVRGWIEDGRR